MVVQAYFTIKNGFKIILMVDGWIHFLLLFISIILIFTVPDEY